MDVTTSDIRQFQQLYKAQFGIELDEKTAKHQLLCLVRQLYEVYKPITAEQLAVFNAKNEYEDINNEQARTASDS